MTPEDPAAAERFETLFDNALNLPVSERAAYLNEACGDDDALRRRLETLVAKESKRSGFMTDPSMERIPNAGEPQLGCTIGPYTLLEEIGEGGHGVVYLAEQREPLQRQVALKIIKPGMDSRQVIARFEAERQALALMDHPNIATVHDAGATSTGRPYFVMELMPGRPITEYCDSNQLSTAERLSLFADVCRAVQHAHQKGIIHRDLKPSNILVTLQDGVPVPKVIDFGIAKAMDRPLTDKTLFTAQRQFIGTPTYCSPEQMEMSGRDVDTRSDVYALGVLLYELLTSTTPFEASQLKDASYEAIARILREVDPPRPSTRITAMRKRARCNADLRMPTSEVDQDLDWIIMKALEKDRERRYPSAEALLQDVQRKLAHEPVEAGAPGVLYRLRKFARRHRAAVAIAAMLVLGSLFSVWQAVRATNAANRERTARVEGRKNLYIADMNVVQNALETGNMERALMLLENHIPGKDGEEDLRHFEWRYHWGQAHRELFSIVADDDPSDDVKPDPISDVVLSPRGDFMAAASRKGVIRLWDLATKEAIFRASIPASMFAWVDISPDGKLLAASGRHVNSKVVETPEVVIWSIDRHVEIHRFSISPSRYARHPQFVSNDSLCVGASDGSLWFYNVGTEIAESLQAHERGGVSVHFNRTANRIVTSGGDSEIHVIDPEIRQVESTLPLSKVRDIARISPNRQWIVATRRYKPNVDIYDIESRQHVATLPFEFPSRGAHFSHDGAMLITSEINGTVRLIDTNDWKEVAHYGHRSHQLNAVAVSDDNSLIVSGGENGVIIGWPGKLDSNHVIRSEGRMVTSVQYAPSGDVLANGCNDGRLELWDPDRKVLLLTIPAQVPVRTDPEPAFADDFFAFSPDSDQIAVALIAGSVDLWDVTRLKKGQSLPHPEPATSVAWSPDGHLLATGSRAAIRLWELPKGEMIRSLDGVGQVMCLAFSQNGEFLASESRGEPGIEVWDVDTLEQVASLTEHLTPPGENHSVLFSPDGSLLATAGYDSRVILWDTRTWEPMHILLGHRAIVVDLSFTTDGKRLASSALDNECVFWDVETGQEVLRFDGYAHDIRPDGNAFAVGGKWIYNEEDASPQDSSVKIYPVSSLDQIDRKRPRK